MTNVKFASNMPCFLDSGAFGVSISKKDRSHSDDNHHPEARSDVMNSQL